VTTFAERQAARRAAGMTATAGILDRLEAKNPVLREMAERLLDARPPPTPAEMARPPAGEAVRTLAGMRVLAAKRELRDLAVRLADEPTDRAALQRVAEITHYVRDAERSGTVPPLDWQALLEREKTPPRSTRADR